MASLCLAPLPPPSPSHSRKLSEPSYSASLNSYSHITGGDLKPIVVNGNPPTFVSAPGRRIVAGLFSFSSLSFLVYLALQSMLSMPMLSFVGIFGFFCTPILAAGSLVYVFAFGLDAYSVTDFYV
jgi:hypothetical protein